MNLYFTDNQQLKLPNDKMLVARSTQTSIPVSKFGKLAPKVAVREPKKRPQI